MRGRIRRKEKKMVISDFHSLFLLYFYVMLIVVVKNRERHLLQCECIWTSCNLDDPMTIVWSKLEKCFYQIGVVCNHNISLFVEFCQFDDIIFDFSAIWFCKDWVLFRDIFWSVRLYPLANHIDTNSQVLFSLFSHHN